MKNRFELRGDHAVVFIDYRGETFEMLVDAEDLEKISAFTWRLNKGRSTPYAVAGAKTKTWAHKLIAGIGTEAKVDHRNFNGLDNRKANLEGVDHSTNGLRTRERSNNTSGTRGVSFVASRQKWRAYVKVGGVQKHLGFFDHQADAVIAAADAYEKLNAVIEPPTAEEYERAAEAQAIAHRMRADIGEEQAG